MECVPETTGRGLGPVVKEPDPWVAVLKPWVKEKGSWVQAGAPPRERLLNHRGWVLCRVTTLDEDSCPFDPRLWPPRGEWWMEIQTLRKDVPRSP